VAKRVRHVQHDPEWYLADPRTRKWMIQCAICSRWGYRSDAPTEFFGRSQLEHYFDAINPADPRCGQCRGL
jgi:hypothetical protein